MNPPVAKKVPVTRDLHGDLFVDDYVWMRDREDPDVLAYLEAENAYTAAVIEPFRDEVDAIFYEIKSRIQETDLSVPARRGDYWYVSKTEEGLQYPIRVRTHGAADGPETVILDENQLAEGFDYFRLTNYAISPNDRIASFAVDTDGGEKYQLRFRDIDTGADLQDSVNDVYYGVAWSAASDFVFYIRPDAAMRPYQVWRHCIGTDESEDVLVFQEDDDRMFVEVSRTRSGEYVIIELASHATSGAYYIPADNPTSAPLPVRPMVDGIEYRVDHQGDSFWIVLNDQYSNGELLRAKVADPHNWETVLGVDDHHKLVAPDAFADHLVVWGRRDGLATATVIFEGQQPRQLEFSEVLYTVWPDTNLEYDTPLLRFGYQSMLTPRTVYDENLVTGERTMMKQTPVLGGYDSDDYVQVREWAEAGDGERVPISIMYRKGVKRDGTAAGMLYGYGSYEHTVDPTFSVARLSLVDRGVVFAIAHIRGGGAMGRNWYQTGKMHHKDNTFGDFVACAEHLAEHGFIARGRLAIRGGSAGGLLMGAVANRRPELFRAVVAQVPFVDVTNTMLDATLPLTIPEWEEWGNPQLAEHYGWIRKYSPYENVTAQDYPAMFVTAGLNDPRVQYWEAAKWVARLRSLKTDGNPLVLKTELGAGHGGRSGRYDAWRDEAEVLAFVLNQLDVE